MMKEEFLRIAQIDSIPHEDYALIEEVYNWHPSIDTKLQIVTIWKAGGMQVIRDMLPTAKAAAARDTEIRLIRAEISALNKKLEQLLHNF